MILLYKMPGKKSRQNIKKMGKKINPQKKDKDKKKTKRKIQNKPAVMPRQRNGKVASDFVQREREMNQAPGGRLDVKIH